MELKGNDLVKYKEILVNCLKVFDSFCLKHNLKYYAAYGTALGAIRHHGFIPWDDDIDVIMPRKDYDRLLDLKEEFGDSYKVFSICDKGYYKKFAKFVDMRTSLWEDKNIPFMIGAFIDIFPLDGTPSDDITESLKFRNKYVLSYWNIKRSMATYSFAGMLKNLILPLDIITVIKNLYSALWLKLRKDSLIKKHSELEDTVKKFRNGLYYASYWGIYKDKEIVPKEWFNGSIVYPFENYHIRVPINYDNYLKHLYGDYMKLPPIEKQDSHHTHYYYNLEKRVTIEEARKIIDNGL